MALGDEVLGSLSLGERGSVKVDVSVGAREVVVVYSEATGRIRRFMASDRAGEINKIDLSEGEAFMKIPENESGNQDVLQAYVNSIIGKSPASDRYVVVDGGGNIVSAILADPMCGDALPGYELVQHDTADSTWTFNTQTRQFTAPPALNPRGI